MKHLLKWAFPIILGIVPTFGTESSSIVEITDSFFTKNFAYISETIEKADGKIIMTVAADTAEKNDEMKIEPTCTVVGYTDEDDESKSYREIIEASVKCGDQILKEKLTRKAPVPYPSQILETNMVGGSPVKDEELPLGVIADLRKETVFTRPSDKRELRKRGASAGQVVARGLYQDREITTPQEFLALGIPILKVHKTKLESTDTHTKDTDPVIYELVLKTKVSPAGVFHKCVDHNFQETSFKGLKKQVQQRCCLGTYEKFSENLQVMRRVPSGAEVLLFDEPTVKKIKLFESSRQQRNGQNVPTSHCLEQKHQYLPDTPLHEVVASRPTPN